jgi:hypothetical protein
LAAALLLTVPPMPLLLLLLTLPPPLLLLPQPTIQIAATPSAAAIFADLGIIATP